MCRVTVKDTLHVLQVLFVHADEIIVATIVRPTQQCRPLPVRIHAVGL